MIPAIVQKLEGKEIEVIDLVYMNPEALELSIKSGEVFRYRRSTEQLERLGLESEIGFRIKSVKIGKKHRSLLITVSGDEKLKNRQSFQIEIFK